MTNHASTIRIVLFSALLVLPAAVSNAAAPTSAEPSTADKVLGDWYATFTQAKAVMSEFDAKIEATGKGQSPKSEITAFRLVLERPNKLLVASTRGAGMAVVADDKQVYEYLASKKKFHIKDKPLESFAKLDEAQVLNYVNYGLGLGLVDAALRSSSFDDFYRLFSSPEYVGLEGKGPTAQHHLRVTRDYVPLDVWISQADNKLMRIAVADMKPVIEKLTAREPVVQAKAGETPPPPKEGFPPDVNVSMTVIYKNWKFDPPITATMFKTPPAPGAELVYDIFAEPDHPLLGKRAPGFVTQSLQGQPVSAAALAGKVVMLDFWATWCPPCVAALPKVNETATKYRDKGVVFLAVNCQEDAADINAFLTEKNLNVPVVMDSTGEIAKLYGVSGIPQTVIIDKKGMVQVVHVGAGANIGDQLARELDDVLAGKDLLAGKLKR